MLQISQIVYVLQFVCFLKLRMDVSIASTSYSKVGEIHSPGNDDCLDAGGSECMVGRKDCVKIKQ